MNTTDPTSIVALFATDPTACAEALLHILASGLPASTRLLVYTSDPQTWAAANQVLRDAPHERQVMEDRQWSNHLEAVNDAASRMDGPEGADFLAVLRDDVRVGHRWLQGLHAVCLEPEGLVLHGVGGRTMTVPMQSVGVQVGIAAPTSDQAAGAAQRLQLSDADAAMGLEAYAAARAAHFAGHATLADRVDGFAVVLTRTAVQDLTLDWTRPLVADDMGPWAWADMCLRAGDMGHQTVVAEAVYVARTTSVRQGHHVVGHVEERLAFYNEHDMDTTHVLVAAVVVSPERLVDMDRLRLCLQRVAAVCRGGVALVVAANPLTILDDDNYEEHRVKGELKRLLKHCDGADASGVARAFAHWAKASVPNLLAVGCRVYTGPAELRCARSEAMRLAQGMGAEAILVLQHDELLEPGVDHTRMQRILRHPNPLVRVFDVGIVTHHGTTDLVREDGGWGHGGTYRGGPHGGRLYRLRPSVAVLPIAPGTHAPAVPDHGPSAHRVAGVRLRQLSVLTTPDRQRLGINESGEGMRVAQWTGKNRIGIHMLVWEGEDPEDVARWLDDVHALVDDVVLVWTGEWSDDAKQSMVASRGAGVHADDCDMGEDCTCHRTSGPCDDLLQVALVHGATWVHEPLDDNLAQARNAGINTLAQNGIAHHAWFVDPDEWLHDPLNDCITLRNMAMSSRWGWLFQVANYRPGNEAPNVSDSVRICSLEGGHLRMNGRVHESFDRAIHALQDKGIQPRLSYAPFILQHRGMAFSDDAMAGKLDKYERLLRMELEESPYSPGAWVSLGWHYFNDGHPDMGVECYQRALACAGTSYLPYKELGYYHLRAARALFDGCGARLSDGHQFHKLCGDMQAWLAKYAPPHPVIPRPHVQDAQPLPEWTPPAPGAATR